MRKKMFITRKEYERRIKQARPDAAEKAMKESDIYDRINHIEDKMYNMLEKLCRQMDTITEERSKTEK